MQTVENAIAWRRAPATLPAGERLYAIGDIHGCVAPLRRLHAAIREDLRANPVRRALLVHLGDYIDRGPDSAGAIDAVRGFDACATVNLLGNHEATLLDALGGDAAAGTDWLYYGGKEALASWGLPTHAPRETWAAGIPAAHHAFLRGLATHHRHGPYFFAHAGVRPGVPLNQQSTDDLTRIRGPFLDSEADHGAVVVHGHTPVRERVADIRPNRVNLDTGAVYGGVLTCALFEEDRIGLITA
jgi:serine/threonine protein phosphatase 1